MKKKIFLHSCLLLFTCMAASCSKNYTENAIGFTEIANDLKSKFGEDACYTNISVLNGSTTGTILNVTVAGKTCQKKPGEYNYMHGSWNRTAKLEPLHDEEEVTFDIKEEASMSLLGQLIEKSKGLIRIEKNISDIQLGLASIIIPPESNKVNLNYSIILKPKNSPTTFSFLYNYKGELLKKNY